MSGLLESSPSSSWPTVTLSVLPPSTMRLASASTAALAACSAWLASFRCRSCSGRGLFASWTPLQASGGCQDQDCKHLEVVRTRTGFWGGPAPRQENLGALPCAPHS